MEEKILILEDQYGNSLENFEIEGDCQCLYLKADGSQEEVLNQAFTKGVVQGELPARTTDVTSVKFDVTVRSEFYNSATKNVADRELVTPEKLPLGKKPISKQERLNRVEMKTQVLQQAVTNRISQQS
jgi:hypothetical protein